MQGHDRARNRLERNRSPLLSALPTLALAFGLGACEREVIEDAPPLRPVRYEQVRSSGGERVRIFSGSAQAGVESRLSFRVGGMVQEVNVVVGERVRDGQILARIDAADYQRQVQEAQAGLAAAEAARRNARAEYERVRSLYENENASRSQLDGARASFESGEAQVEASGQRLELSRSRLSYTTLDAPVAGSIAAVMIEINENIQPGQMVMLLNYGGMPEVQVGVPEVVISEVRRGADVTVTFDALPNRSFPATVTEVGVASTLTATTFPVIVRLQESDPAIRSGMAAEVAFRFGGDDEAETIFVPELSVLEDGDGRFVFVVEPSADGKGTVHRRPVTIGDELTSDGLEVREGLAVGELVVTAGVRRLAEGMEVRLLEEGP